MIHIFRDDNWHTMSNISKISKLKEMLYGVIDENLKNDIINFNTISIIPSNYENEYTYELPYISNMSLSNINFEDNIDDNKIDMVTVISDLNNYTKDRQYGCNLQALRKIYNNKDSIPLQLLYTQSITHRLSFKLKIKFNEKINNAKLILTYKDNPNKTPSNHLIYMSQMETVSQLETVLHELTKIYKIYKIDDQLNVIRYRLNFSLITKYLIINTKLKFKEIQIVLKYSVYQDILKYNNDELEYFNNTYIINLYDGVNLSRYSEVYIEFIMTEDVKDVKDINIKISTLHLNKLLDTHQLAFGL